MFKDKRKEKGVEVHSLDETYFCTELALIPCQQIKTYKHRSRFIAENNKNNFLKGHQRIGNYFRGGNLAVKINPDDGNLDDVFEVIEGRNVIREGVRAIIDDGHHLLTVGELQKVTDEQYNWTR